jgi:hypothetical protein
MKMTGGRPWNFRARLFRSAAIALMLFGSILLAHADDGDRMSPLPSNTGSQPKNQLLRSDGNDLSHDGDLVNINSLFGHATAANLPSFCEVRLHRRLVSDGNAGECKVRNLWTDFLPAIARNHIDAVDVADTYLVDLLQADTRHLETLFDLLGSSATGRGLLRVFLPRFQRGEIEIRDMRTDPDFTRYSGEIKEGVTSAAETRLQSDGKTVIDLNFGRPLATLVSNLAHEMQHAIDPEFQEYARLLRTIDSGAVLRKWLEFKATLPPRYLEMEKRLKRDRGRELLPTDLSPSDREKLAVVLAPFIRPLGVAIYRTERKAYDSEWKVTKEVSGAFSCLSHAAVFGPPSYMTDSEILRNYEIEPLYVRDYHAINPANPWLNK